MEELEFEFDPKLFKDFENVCEKTGISVAEAFTAFVKMAVEDEEFLQDLQNN